MKLINLSLDYKNQNIILIHQKKKVKRKYLPNSAILLVVLINNWSKNPYSKDLDLSRVKYDGSDSLAY